MALTTYAHSHICRICLIRHGETAWNTERRLQGHLDIPLNETGLAQAASTACHLSNTTFSALYASDLVRAHETALIIANAQHPPPPVQLSASLRERHYGVLQGLTYDEAHIQHPEAFHHLQARTLHYAFSNQGENLETFAQRIEETLNTLSQRHAGEQILLITHGGVLDIVYRLVMDIPLETKRTWQIPNAAINWIECCDKIWHLSEWALQNHLEQSHDELPSS